MNGSAIDKGHILTEVAKASLIAFVVGVINFAFEEGKRRLLLDVSARRNGRSSK